MKATRLLHKLGQSLWLDKLSRHLRNNAFAEHGGAGPIMAVRGVAAEKVLTPAAQAGVDEDNLATRLQDGGAKGFVRSGNGLPAVIEFKFNALKQAV